MSYPAKNLLDPQSNLRDPVEEMFAYLVASGKSFTEAIRIADPDRPAPHNAGARIAKLPRVATRIKELSGANLADLTEVGLRQAEKRMASLEARWFKLNCVVKERGADYEAKYPDVPGGSTGLVTWKYAEGGQRWHYLDHKLLAELREIEKLAHEWDKRSASLKSLHLHAHQHGDKVKAPWQDRFKAMPPEKQEMALALFPDIGLALELPQSSNAVTTEAQPLQR